MFCMQQSILVDILSGYICVIGVQNVELHHRSKGADPNEGSVEEAETVVDHV